LIAAQVLTRGAALGRTGETMGRVGRWRGPGFE